MHIVLTKVGTVAVVGNINFALDQTYLLHAQADKERIIGPMMHAAVYKVSGCTLLGVAWKVSPSHQQVVVELLMWFLLDPDAVM